LNVYEGLYHPLPSSATGIFIIADGCCISRGGKFLMRQTNKTEQVVPSFTKKIGQTTFKVNVHFAENDTATFEDRLMHLLENDISAGKIDSL
jgi:hypothetical protein